MFGVLGADDTPMVRRAAAKALGVSYSESHATEQKLADYSPFS